MNTSISAAQTRVCSRRTFLKGLLFGAAGAVAVSATPGSPLAAVKNDASPLPGPGSIFAPRRQDLERHWRQKLARFRLS